MMTRTWAYGTELPGKVLMVDENVRMPSGGLSRIVTVGSGDEGFILVGDPAKVKPGDEVTIVFRKGGPNGGYWAVK